MSKTWKVSYTRHAVSFIKNNIKNKRIAEQVFGYRKLLETMPDLGRNYDPEYPAAKPPFPCRYIAIPDTPFTMYYLKNEATQEIVIFSIDHQRKNSEAWFAFVDF